MARSKGGRYPSDQRRWFRVESPQLADDTAEMNDAEFRAFILILAWANETQAHERDDTVYISRHRLTSVAPNRRGSVATSARVVRELCAKQSWALQESDAKWTIKIRNYSQKQGFAPSVPQPDPDETPATTTTPTTTPTTMMGAIAPTPWGSGFTQMLKGVIPTGLNGQGWDSPAEWLGFHEGLIRSEAEIITGHEDGDEFTKTFKNVMHRFWNNKQPRARTNGSAPKETQAEKVERIGKEQWDEWVKEHPE